MEFFDKLGKKASEAYRITADKTGKIAKETKLKLLFIIYLTHDCIERKITEQALEDRSN